MCSASEEEVGGSAALNCGERWRQTTESSLISYISLTNQKSQVSGIYLAVVEVTGRAVGVGPEQSGEQADGWRRRRRFRLQWALWFGRQTAPAPLQAISAHDCGAETDSNEEFVRLEQTQRTFSSLADCYQRL